MSDLTHSEKRLLSRQCRDIQDLCADQRGSTRALFHLASAALVSSDYPLMRRVVTTWDAKAETTKKSLARQLAWRQRKERERYARGDRPAPPRLAPPRLGPASEDQWVIWRFDALRIALEHGAGISHPLNTIADRAQDKWSVTWMRVALWAWDQMSLDDRNATMDKAATPLWWLLSDRTDTEHRWWIPVLRGERPNYTPPPTGENARLTRSEQMRLRALKERLQEDHEDAAD